MWLFTLTHRRAVEVVRREQACLERDSRHQREMTPLGQDSLEELILGRVEDDEASLSTISAAGGDVPHPGRLPQPAPVTGPAGIE